MSDPQQQVQWDLEDVTQRLHQLHQLHQRLAAAEQARTEARSVYARAIADEKEARGRLLAALEADAQPLPLFDGQPHQQLHSRAGESEKALEPVSFSWDRACDFTVTTSAGDVEVYYTPGMARNGHIFGGHRFDFHGQAVGGKDYHCFSVEKSRELSASGIHLRPFAEGMVQECIKQHKDGSRPRPAEPSTNPLDHPCPKCHVGPGEKCRNYKGKGKQPCSQRGKPVPSPELEARED